MVSTVREMEVLRWRGHLVVEKHHPLTRN